MKEIKFYGRGGQGIVTAGEITAKCCLLEGKYAQFIPTFGPERRGGPSICSLRISDEPILLKCNVGKADVACVFDRTIWKFLDIGLKEDGIAIFNSAKKISNFEKKSYIVDATDIAIRILGRNITNTTMLGAFSKVTGLIKIDTLINVLKEMFDDKAEKNIECALEAYNKVEE
ncbi:MAG: 2-oxoacid:acceptor oxidoreductase family protein [Candidatus Thermoplasmatota archaeon]